ncbi:hypothetical protein DBR32_02645 [Taibaiella sp. KBW10]|nr:hypothetical protein DBR32_02645 [Taibaiella sp. KBW10]
MILLLLTIGHTTYAQTIDIYKEAFHIPNIVADIAPMQEAVTVANVQQYTRQLEQSNYQVVAHALGAYKEEHHLSDWMYYQMVRRTANYLNPKVTNYVSYTLLKWYFMRETGFDVRLAIIKEQLLFYVQSNEDVYDVPYFVYEGKSYICLNRHDFQKIDFDRDELQNIPLDVPKNKLSAFSYKINQLPDFTENNFSNKLIDFTFNNVPYQFDIKVNKAMDTLFVNYPVLNYDAYFNIPVSNSTYQTLIPELKKAIHKMPQRKGVEYLMEFVRNAFTYESDIVAVGKEQRFSPELTLINDKSDCDDRIALFYFLVKEVYNLPMVVVRYPSHVMLAVKLDHIKGATVSYNNEQYVICEPTPQAKALKVGEIADKYKNQVYEIAYAYHP